MFASVVSMAGFIKVCVCVKVCVFYIGIGQALLFGYRAFKTNNNTRNSEYMKVCIYRVLGVCPQPATMHEQVGQRGWRVGWSPPKDKEPDQWEHYAGHKAQTCTPTDRPWDTEKKTCRGRKRWQGLVQVCLSWKFLTLTVLVTTVDALQHFETG